MDAVRIHDHGGPEVLVLDDLPLPSARAGEALVRVEAAGLNHLDLWVRKGARGRHELKIGLPRVLGSDVAGRIMDTLGELPNGMSIGDAVVIAPGRGCGVCNRCSSGKDHLCRQYDVLGVHRDGGYSQVVSVPVTDLLPMPSHLTFDEAACLPLAYMTAWNLVVEMANVQPGEWILVHAVAGGVGTAALQIALSLGAKVIGTASSREKLDRACAMGMEWGIDYATEDFVAICKEATGGRGVDVVVDSVGGEVFERSVSALGFGGRVVSCGATAEGDVNLNLHALHRKRASLGFTVMGSRSHLSDVLDAVNSSGMRPVVGSVLRLSEAAEAHELLESRLLSGKVILRPGPL